MEGSCRFRIRYFSLLNLWKDPFYFFNHWPQQLPPPFSILLLLTLFFLDLLAFSPHIPLFLLGDPVPPNPFISFLWNILIKCLLFKFNREKNSIIFFSSLPLSFLYSHPLSSPHFSLFLCLSLSDIFFFDGKFIAVRLFFCRVVREKEKEIE